MELYARAKKFLPTLHHLQNIGWTMDVGHASAPRKGVIPDFVEPTVVGEVKFLQIGAAFERFFPYPGQRGRETELGQPGAPRKGPPTNFVKGRGKIKITKFSYTPQTPDSQF